MRAVNLLPPDLRNAKSIRHEEPAVVVGSALGVIVMIALGSAFLDAHGKANAQQAQLTKARLELAQLSTSRTPMPEAGQAERADHADRAAARGDRRGGDAGSAPSSTNLSQRIAWDRVLREVSLVVPSDVTLTQLTMTAPTPTAKRRLPRPARPGAQGFVIQGSAFSYDSVARLLSRLALVPDLSDVTLSSTSSGALRRRARARPLGGAAACSSTSPPRSRGRRLRRRRRCPRASRPRPTRRGGVAMSGKLRSRRAQTIAHDRGRRSRCCSCSAGSCSSRRSARPRRASRAAAAATQVQIEQAQARRGHSRRLR